LKNFEYLRVKENIDKVYPENSPEYKDSDVVNYCKMADRAHFVEVEDI